MSITGKLAAVWRSSLRWRCLENMLLFGASQDEAAQIKKKKKNFHRWNVYQATDWTISTIQTQYCFKGSHLGVHFSAYFDADANIASHQRRPFSEHLFEIWTILPLFSAIKRVCNGPFTCLVGCIWQLALLSLYFCILSCKLAKISSQWQTGHQSGLQKNKAKIFILSSSNNINLFSLYSGRDIFLHGFNGVAHFRELN